MKYLTFITLATKLCAPGAAATTAVLLALSATTPAMGATYTGSSSAGSGTIQVPGPSNSDSFSGAVPNTSSSSSSVLTGAIDPSGVYMYASSTSTGSSSTGAAHAMATATAEANNPAVIGGGSANAQASASATGALSDVFELNAAGYAPGTMVAMTFAIDVSGVFGGGGTTLGGGVLSASSWSGNAWWRATTQLDGYGFEQSQSLFRNSAGANDVIGSDMGTATYTVNVYLGSHSVTLRAETYATASASAFTHSADGASTWASSVFAADLGNTVGWGGILGLSTLDGTAITDFTAVSSTSGFNYANAYSAVPVPSAVWLFGSGLLGLFGVMRRKPAL
jgi:hypothetical protein